MNETQTKSNNKEKTELENKNEQAVDISELITLVYHKIKFPDPSMPNDPQFFEIENPGKDVMSFGRTKLFNDNVLSNVFGIDFKKKSPIHKMKLIRSRLQSFIDQYTFSYMNGLGNALPDTALDDFVRISGDLKVQFEAARKEYDENWSEMRLSCMDYFKSNSQFYPGVTIEAMENAISRKLIVYRSSFDERFMFQITHFDIKPIEMKMEEVDSAEKIAISKARNKVAQQAGADLAIMVEQFKTDVKIELRTSAVKAFTDLLKAIEEEKWNQKSINTVLKYIDKFDKLNFLNDKELELFLSSQKANLSAISAKDIKKSEGSLGSLQALVSDAVGELTQLEAQEKQAIQDAFGSIGNRIIDPF